MLHSKLYWFTTIFLVSVLIFSLFLLFRLKQKVDNKEQFLKHEIETILEAHELQGYKYYLKEDYHAELFERIFDAKELDTFKILVYEFDSSFLKPFKSIRILPDEAALILYKRYLFDDYIMPNFNNNIKNHRFSSFPIISSINKTRDSLKLKIIPITFSRESLSYTKILVNESFEITSMENPFYYEGDVGELAYIITNPVTKEQKTYKGEKVK